MRKDREEILKKCYAQGKPWRSLVGEGLADNYGTNKWTKSFVGFFSERNPKRAYILVKLKRAIGKTPQWEDITDDNLLKFRMYLYKKVSQSTISTICSIMRSFIDENLSLLKIGKDEAALINYKEILSVEAKGQTKLFYLTEKECEKINNYNTHGIIEDYVKKIFMIMCYTGARYEDSKLLNFDNCDSSSDTLAYVCSDTKQLCKIPVHKNLKIYLSTRAECKINRRQFIEALRSICFKAGVRSRCVIVKGGKSLEGYKYQYISPIIARCSFATNLYLRKADIGTITSMMGISENVAIRKFICAKRKNDGTALNFFK